MIQASEIAFPSQAKPFVKWVGGKAQLLGEIAKRLPEKFTTYVEPFVGGGAVLFWILKHCPNIERAIINDLNGKLINVYRAVKNEPHALIDALRELELQYLLENSVARTEFYLAQRQRFNEENLTGTQSAAIFIFLNRTCFNGLYRENSKGNFNVPHGKYSRPTICDTRTILADSQLLQKVEILNGDFSGTQKFADGNALFYLDPPYKPLSETSSFNNYVKENFGDNEQVRLRDFCNSIAQKGAKFILSNSDLKGKNPADNFFDDLYSCYEISRVLATRMVNANPEKRGKLTELMISNCVPAGTENLFPELTLI